MRFLIHMITGFIFSALYIAIAYLFSNGLNFDKCLLYLLAGTVTMMVGQRALIGTRWE